MSSTPQKTAQEADGTGIAGAVRSRRVFYIPGYDPMPPRRYRELYRREAAAQAAISGYRIDMEPGQEEGFGWTVRSLIDEAQVETHFSVLVWSDIVQESMSRSIPATYGQLLHTTWTYLATGVFRHLARLRKGPVIAALYPVAMLVAYLVIAALLGGLAGAVVFRAGAAVLPASIATVIAFMAGAGGALWLLRRLRRMDGRTFVFYLMHNYADVARTGGAYSAEMEERLTDFRRQVADAMTSNVDEVLIVGHSSGAHLAVSVLADLIREGQRPASGPSLGLLTLGQVIPMVSFLPDAHRLRADLRYLSTRAELTWIDVTAPGDGCAFALCDPVAVTGVASEGKRWPLVISAAFTQTLSPERWKALRWRFFRLHFQYLCAFDRPGAYDYFRVTAGPETLAKRFEGRGPSRSRIETPSSKYTSVAPA